MFDFIRNLFWYKADSLEEFAEVIKREGCREKILVKPCLAAKNGVYTASVGVIANFQNILEFTATTSRGRKVVYQQCFFERFGSDRGFADAKERRNAAIKLFLLGEQEVKELRAKLPGVSVELIGPNGRPMNEAMYAKLHRDAAACGVSI
jgi:hypothetical protein